MGHATIQTTFKYTHFAKGHLRALVDDGSEEERSAIPLDEEREG